MFLQAGHFFFLFFFLDGFKFDDAASGGVIPARTLIIRAFVDSGSNIRAGDMQALMQINPSRLLYFYFFKSRQKRGVSRLLF